MSNLTISSGRSLFMRLSSPYVLALPIILITALAGTFDLSDIPRVFTAGVLIIFCITSGLYTLLCRGGMIKPAVALGLVTNGMLVIFFSFLFSSGITFDFLGFVTVMTGIVVGMAAAAPTGGRFFARNVERIVPQSVSIEEFGKIIEAIQFPCVFMERDGNRAERIISYNRQFALEFGLENDRISGNELDDLLPLKPGKSQFRHKDEEWVIKRTVRGRQILTILSPAVRSKEAAGIEVFDAIDVSTGLYSSGFMKYKAKSDVESVNRGRRPLTAVLFRLTFPPAAADIPDEEQKLAATVMGRTVHKAIRACDSAYRISDNEVLLIMPDTERSGAMVVISRVHALFKKVLTVEFPGLSKAVLHRVDRDFIGGSDLPPYDKILGELHILFDRKHTN